LYKLAGRAFSFGLVCHEAMATTRDVMQKFTDPERRKILIEILDLIDRIFSEFKKASDLTKMAFLNPQQFPSESTLADCIVEWSGLTKSIFHSLVFFNSSEFDCEPANRLIIFGLQNIIFSMI